MAAGNAEQLGPESVPTPLPLPWTEYEAALAGVKQDWFVSDGRAELLAMGTALNVADMTCQGTVNGLYTTWATDTAVAQRVFDIALANGEFATDASNFGAASSMPATACALRRYQIG